MKIRRWLNQWGMQIIVMSVIFAIGYYIFTTIKYTIETTPDVTEIGGPPNIETMIPLVIVLLLLCIIIEYLKRCEGVIK